MSGIKPQLQHKGGKDVSFVITLPGKSLIQNGGPDAVLEYNMGPTGRMIYLSCVYILVFIIRNSISTSKEEIIQPRRLPLVASQDMASICINTGN